MRATIITAAEQTDGDGGLGGDLIVIIYHEKYPVWGYKGNSSPLFLILKSVVQIRAAANYYFHYQLIC